MNLLTKKQIVESWDDLNHPKNNELCCPHCRDNLLVYENDNDSYLYCYNHHCDNNEVYNKNGDVLGKQKELLPIWITD